MTARASSRALSVYIGAACLVLMMPIVIVLVRALGDQTYMRFPPDSFSLRWFATFFGDPRWQRALGSSVLIAAIACVIATVLGFFAAYACVRSEMRAKKLSETHTVRPSLATASTPGWPKSLGKLPKVVWLVQAPPFFVHTETRALLEG